LGCDHINALYKFTITYLLTYSSKFGTVVFSSYYFKCFNHVSDTETKIGPQDRGQLR